MAPLRAPKFLSSLLVDKSLVAGVNLKPTDRYIDVKKDRVHALVLYDTKIIVGFGTSEINIYSSTDLHCEIVIRYCNDRAGVLSLQCTGSEVIAGYSDSSIQVWEIRSGQWVDTITAGMTPVADVEVSYAMEKSISSAGQSQFENGSLAASTKWYL